MTNLLCRVCNREIFENQLELDKYIASLRNPNDKSIYKNYTINNINLDDVNKILDDYISIHNKNFDFYFINCVFEIRFDNNFTATIEIINHYNTDHINIKSYLSFYTDSCESGGFKFSNINHMIFNTISCMCNMSYKHYINQPMSMLERRISFIIARNPQLINSLDRNKNQPLINKYSHIPINKIRYRYRRI